MSHLAPAVLRLAHPLIFSAFLREIGAPAAGYFRRQGLPVLCTDPDTFVPLRMAWGLFEDAARREDRFIGWRVGRFAGDNGLSGGLLSKLDDAPSLIVALRRLVRMISTEASHLQIGILKRRNGIVFYTRYPGSGKELNYMVSQSYQLEAYIDLIRHFAGSDWQPKVIGLESSVYPEFLPERFPNSQIRINQPFGYLVIARSCLHHKVRASHTNGGDCRPPIDTRTLSCAELLPLLLEPHLQDGCPRLSLAASLMGTSTRTLTRRLAECGTSYQAVVDNLRYSRAKQMLVDTDQPIADVAWSVGFSDQANFTRMFRRIAGLTPRQFRSAAECGQL